MNKNERRYALERCYHSIPLHFKGRIQKKNKKYVCFERIYISGMYPDGLMYDDKEDHVWMDITGFDKYSEGQALSFTAEVYEYVKTGHGKSKDFGLRNPENIQPIRDYELPSDEEIMSQEMDILRCEMCPMYEQCNMDYCMMGR